MAKVAKAKNTIFWAIVVGLAVGVFTTLIAVATLSSTAVFLGQ